MNARMVNVLRALLLVLGVSYFAAPGAWAPALLGAERWRSGLSVGRQQVAERQFAFLEGGDGQETIVMLHGFTANKDHWTRFAAHVGKRYRILAVDVPGHGGTPNLPGDDLGFEAQAERIHALLAARGLTRYHLIGNSMGGHLAGTIASRHPDEVISLAMLEPHGMAHRAPSRFDDLRARGEEPILTRTSGDYERLLAMTFVDRPFIPYPVAKMFERDALARAHGYARFLPVLFERDVAHLESIAPTIAAPTLVVWGDSNRFLNIDMMAPLQRLLPRASIHVMRACGHTAMVERPAETAEIYLAFLTRISLPETTGYDVRDGEQRSPASSR